MCQIGPEGQSIHLDPQKGGIFVANLLLNQQLSFSSV
jgi:hypothetical protein